MFPENGLHFLAFASTELFLLGGTVQKVDPKTVKAPSMRKNLFNTAAPKPKTRPTLPYCNSEESALENANGHFQPP